MIDPGLRENPSKSPLHESEKQNMLSAVKQFLEAHKIVDCLPENLKVVVLNHDLTIAQAIQA
jgi:hypothetical protein